jgi:uncharacterized protein (TIGR03437 family)
MGLMRRGTLLWVLLFTGVVCPLAAAPKLRLVETTIGPVSVAQGGTGPTRTVEAYNGGDGTLALSVSSSAPWAVASVGASRNCSARAGSCIPIQVALNTASLARASYTATVTVSDPNALDAPQTITVTVLAGGGVPDRLDLFVAPNGSTAETSFTTNSAQLQARAATESGGNWLSVALDGIGSFRFVLPYRVLARHLAGMAEGSYRGTITTVGSSLAADNKTIPVSLQVTSQLIAQAAPAALQLRYAQGIAKQRVNISVANRGLGSLSISGATATTAAGGNWLAAELVPGYPLVQAVIDTSTVAPGSYQGTVSIATNAANGAISVPVQLEVIAQAPPRALGQGVVNNATFEPADPVAQGAIAAVFGEQFSFKDPAQAPAVPLKEDLNGVRVLVNDKPAPIYYVSYGQINFQIPYDAAPGDAVVRVERDGQRGNPISVVIVSSAPRLLRLGIGDYGIVVNNQDGSFPIPATPGIASRPALAGEALVIYAIGLGPTTPATPSGVGAPLEPLARVEPPFQVVFGSGFGGGVAADPLFVGLTPGFVGLYQVNVVVSPEAPKGDHVRIALQRGGVLSNIIEIAIQ